MNVLIAGCFFIGPLLSWIVVDALTGANNKRKTKATAIPVSYNFIHFMKLVASLLRCWLCGEIDRGTDRGTAGGWVIRLTRGWVCGSDVSHSALLRRRKHGDENSNDVR